jgi:hypothetical protein
MPSEIWLLLLPGSGHAFRHAVRERKQIGLSRGLDSGKAPTPRESEGDFSGRAVQCVDACVTLKPPESCATPKSAAKAGAFHTFTARLKARPDTGKGKANLEQ